jgi:hypothetical protein
MQTHQGPARGSHSAWPAGSSSSSRSSREVCQGRPKVEGGGQPLNQGGGGAGLVAVAPPQCGVAHHPLRHTAAH